MFARLLVHVAIPGRLRLLPRGIDVRVIPTRQPGEVGITTDLESDEPMARMAVGDLCDLSGERPR